MFLKVPISKIPKLSYKKVTEKARRVYKELITFLTSIYYIKFWHFFLERANKSD